MCGRKSQETNGEKGINSSQLAAAQHLMLTLKLCQKKCKVSLHQVDRQSFILHGFSLFQTLQTQIHHSKVIMKKDLCGWLALEHTDAATPI